MQRLEFEQLVLEMVFEVGYEKLTPASVAYFLRIPIKVAEANLDELARDSVLDIEVDDDGRVFYVLPSPAHAPNVLDQTVMRRSARGLGSHFAVAELAARSNLGSRLEYAVLEAIPSSNDGTCCIITFKRTRSAEVHGIPQHTFIRHSFHLLVSTQSSQCSMNVVIISCAFFLVATLNDSFNENCVITIKM